MILPVDGTAGMVTAVWMKTGVKYLIFHQTDYKTIFVSHWFHQFNPVIL